ncbi:hypothetical protein [Candidatus Allofournierella merdipullorum]|uniref:hypothetical protein n=1 Tax=Candidatus Allofournierella merdipullorum TaxID=2838595 RepID=UPI003AB32BD9
MKEKKQSIVRRLVAAGLCLALAVSTFSPLVFAQGGVTVETVPAASQEQPAESTVAPAAEMAAVQAEKGTLCVKVGDEYVGDGATLPERQTVFALYVDNGEKVPVDDQFSVTTRCLTMEGEEIPREVLSVSVMNMDFDGESIPALIFIYMDGEQAENFWNSQKDDMRFQVEISSTEASGTITVTKNVYQSKGVLEDSIPGEDAPAMITAGEYGLYNFTAPAWDAPELALVPEKSVLPLAEDVRLEGDITQYFSLVGGDWKNPAGQCVELVDNSKVYELEDGQTVTGTVVFTDAFTGIEHTAHIAFTYKETRPVAAWYLVDGDKLVEADSATVRVNTSGKLYLRLAAPGQGELSADAETYDVFNGDVSYGVYWLTNNVLSDNKTVEVSYNTKNITAGQSQQIRFIGTRYAFEKDNPDKAFTVNIGENNDYKLAIHSTVDGTPAFAGCYQVIPRIPGGGYAASEQQLKESGITVTYDEADMFSIVAPVKCFEGGQTLDVWAYVMFPLRDSDSDGADPITFDVLRNGELLDEIAVDATTSWAGYNDMIQKGRIIDRAVEQQVDFEEVRSFELVGEDRDNPWIDPTAPVVAGEPVVTGAAKDNFKILWAEGKSTFGIVYLAEQVEGQAVVTIPTRLKDGGGESSVKLIINFAKYAGADRYESLMEKRSVDFKLVESLEVALENGNLNFEQVSVARDRMVENGPFELFFYGLREDGACTFGSDLIEEITFASSDENVLKITANLDKADVSDTINHSDEAYGIQLTPVGTGTCDVTATIKLNRDPYCNTDKTPETVTIGYTFRVHSNESLPTESAQNAQELQAILDRLETTAVPTIIELEGGEYAMDLEVEGLNVILRSKDPSDPAIFTGDPSYEPSDSEELEGPYLPWQAFIVRVNPANAGLSLESIVIDGGNERGGVLHTFTSITAGQLPTPFTLRNCTIKNCITGVMGANSNANSIVLRGCTVEKCQTGVMTATSFNTLFSANTVAYHNPGVPRFCDFIDNQYDVMGIDDERGGVYIEKSMPQNYWGTDDSGKVKTGPVVGVVANDGEENNIIEGRTAEVFSSPYYLDQTHSKLNVDLATTQVEDGTAVLPLQQPESGESDSLVLTADAFAALKEEGLAVSAPIKNSEGKDFASWAFGEITNDTIETNLNISDKLSGQAQGTVDKLPETDQAKILQEVNLSHNGTLPGRATIRIKASEVPDGDVSKLFLYWVKEDGTIVPAEVVDVQYDAETNEFIITVDHCSEYVITSGELTDVPAPTPTTDPKPTPTTDPKPTPTADPQPTAAPGATATPAPTGTPVPGGQPRPTATPDQPTSGNTQEKLFSAQQVMDAFDAQPGDVTLRLNDQPIVSQMAFVLLMERNEGVLRLEGNGYAWSFDRADLTSTELPGGVFDTSVNLQPDESILERIRSYTGDAAMTALDTAFSGALPGKAVLELTVDPAVFGNTRCGLFYLPDAGDPERVATVEVDENGLVKLPLEHCSVYYLVVEETLPEAPDSQPAESVPEQPDETAPAQGGVSPAIPVAVAAAVILVVAVVVYIIARRREE